MGFRRGGLWIFGCLAIGLGGCRCCCLFEPYATAIDHIKDHPVLFDTWYCPQLDISRAGKPDWCGPINRHLGCCRCDGVPEWKYYDHWWRYPSRYPYEYPNQSYPGPNQFATPASAEEPVDEIEERLPPPTDREEFPDAPQPDPPEERSSSQRRRERF